MLFKNAYHRYSGPSTSMHIEDPNGEIFKAFVEKLSHDPNASILDVQYYQTGGILADFAIHDEWDSENGETYPAIFSGIIEWDGESITAISVDRVYVDTGSPDDRWEDITDGDVDVVWLFRNVLKEIGIPVPF